MLTNRRFRFWEQNLVTLSPAKGLAGPAASGESVERLVVLTARSLLEIGQADRAAVLLRSENEAGVLEGSIVDSGFPGLLESWERLDATAPAIARLLENRGPVRLSTREASRLAALGPRSGMKSAIILPLRCADEQLGMALVAYVIGPAPEPLDALESIADHLAVTVSQRRLEARSRRLSAHLNAIADLERRLAAGESRDAILKRVAEVARREARASFIAVARRSRVGSGISMAAFEGPAEILCALGEAWLTQVWRAAAQDRRPAVENLHAVPSEGNWGEALRGQGTAMILTLPLEAGGVLVGTLVVGIGGENSPAAVRETLEPFAALAAIALGDEYIRARAVVTEETLAARLERGTEMILLIDEGGTIRESSRAARERLGLSAGRSNPLRLEEIFPARERQKVVAWRDAAVSGGFPAPVEFSHDSGLQLLLRVLTSELPAGRWQVGVEDLTASRIAERRRKEQDAELAAILDSMESGVLLFDARCRLRLANARFAHLFGLNPQQLAELPDFETLLGAVREHFREPSTVETRWREVLGRGDEAAWDELEILQPSRRVLERFARPVMSEDGERIGWLELYRDITGERLVRSKLMQAEKMAALGQLVSGIAHELNNPLTGIMGYAQLLMRHAPGGERAVEARRILEEAERAGRIVKNLLLFAREKKPERKPVNLNEIIERTLALRSYELKVQNIAVACDTDPNLTPVLADAHQLQQVVLNLLVNAEQAIQQGKRGGQISVRTRQISAHRVSLEVSDDGPGIPSEIAPRIFDPFFTTKPVGTGTGLGLSIVYGIVQEHGGEVTVETRPGEGTRFTIELPTLPTGMKVAAEELPAPPRPAARAARGRRILVIEDEATVAQLVVDVLREEGHQVDVLLDSVEGLAQIARQHYDLVICDLRMPRLDGRELFLSLVREGSGAQHRFIFITGDTLTSSTVEFLESNSLPYLAKPFLVEELKRAVERELEGSVRARRRKDAPRLDAVPGSPVEGERSPRHPDSPRRREGGSVSKVVEPGHDAAPLPTLRNNGG
jgi:signal transduction histidine kinase/CheY-like chemotaxis protein/GAF domain-containing protein